MPTYDFRCPRCGLAFEAVRRFAEADDPAACPRDAAPADRLFSPPADILVRGGFRDALERRAAAAERPRWSPDDLSCHTHEPAPHDHGDGDGYAHERHDHNSAGHAHPHAHGDSHGHAH